MKEISFYPKAEKKFQAVSLLISKQDKTVFASQSKKPIGRIKEGDPHRKKKAKQWNRTIMNTNAVK